MDYGKRNRLIVQNFRASKTRRPSDADFEALFSAFGPVTSLSIIPITNSVEQYPSVAHVVFANENDALRAFEAGQRRELIHKSQTLIATLVSEDYAPIDKLNDDCLLEIFLYLPVEDKCRIDDVCTRWKEHRRLHWFNEKHLCIPHRQLSKEQFEKYITKCGQYCQEVEVHLGNPSETSMIAEKCNSLNSVKVLVPKGSNVNQKSCEAFNTLLDKSKITRIMFRNSNWESTPEIPLGTFLSKLSAEATELHFLLESKTLHWNLGDNRLSRYQNLRALSLVTLDLVEENFSDFEKLENLVCLVLKKCNVDIRLVEKITKFTKLEHLTLSHRNLTDDFLITVVENNKNLEFLSIEDSIYLTDRSVVALASHAKLRVLRLKALPGISLQEIYGFSNLTYLYCLFLTAVDFSDFRRVVADSPYLKVVKVFLRWGMYPVWPNPTAIIKTNGNILHPHFGYHYYVWFENDDACDRTIVGAFDCSGYWSADLETWYIHDKIESME